MKKSFIILLLFSFFYISASAQELNRYHSENHSPNEIGISAGTLYSPNHKEWGMSAHIHYFRTIYHSSWSLGGSVEQAWLDGSHWTFAAGFKYELDHFSFGVLPGVMFLNHNTSEGNIEPEKKTLFSLHTEVVYELLHFGKFHLGPAVDYAWAKNHSHLMFGIHGALNF